MTVELAAPLRSTERSKYTELIDPIVASNGELLRISFDEVAPGCLPCVKQAHLLQAGGHAQREGHHDGTGGGHLRPAQEPSGVVMLGKEDSTNQKPEVQRYLPPQVLRRQAASESRLPRLISSSDFRTPLVEGQLVRQRESK